MTWLHQKVTHSWHDVKNPKVFSFSCYKPHSLQVSLSRFPSTVREGERDRGRKKKDESLSPSLVKNQISLSSSILLYPRSSLQKEDLDTNQTHVTQLRLSLSSSLSLSLSLSPKFEAHLNLFTSQFVTWYNLSRSSVGEGRENGRESSLSHHHHLWHFSLVDFGKRACYSFLSSFVNLLHHLRVLVTDLVSNKPLSQKEETMEVSQRERERKKERKRNPTPEDDDWRGLFYDCASWFVYEKLFWKPTWIILFILLFLSLFFVLFLSLSLSFSVTCRVTWNEKKRKREKFTVNIYYQDR